MVAALWHVFEGYGTDSYPFVTAQTCAGLTGITGLDSGASTCASAWDVPNTCGFVCDTGYTASTATLTCTATDTYTPGPAAPTCTGAPHPAHTQAFPQGTILVV